MMDNILSPLPLSPLLLSPLLLVENGLREWSKRMAASEYQ